MSFFGSKLFGLGTSSTSGNNSSESSISGAETIERLCDRLTSSLLIEDRHDSLKTIKSLSKKYKLEVGTQAMPVLIDVIKQNTTDPELVSLALDTLCNIMNPQEDSNLPADLSHQFTEMFIKDNANLILLFDLIDEFEFQVRWSSVKLVNQLVLNQVEQLQDKILIIPRGVSRLIDLLNDSREIIRNESILILNLLTKTNANIQKIIAFESGFDKIMEIIESEGNVLDGGVIVEDCFNLLLNLLKTNPSNQSFFKEANYLKKLCKYFELGENDAQNWTGQKLNNLTLLLKLMRCLVAPNNQQQLISDCQKAYNHFGLLHRLCVLLTWPGVPSDLLSQAIGTVGEVIRGNSANQQLFSTVIMQSNPPRPIIIILLLSMINEKQPFNLRSSILYCFECFLYKNEEKKSEIIETLLPKENVQPQLNTGQILCTGLFAPNDFVSNWLCAVALAHTINENNNLKEQLLRVQLAVNVGSNNIQAVSLLQQCMNILNECSNSTGPGQKYQYQTKVSILMLISTWLSNCPSAVDVFLSHEQNIPYLISQASASDTEDKSLIIQGLSSFCLGLSMLYNSNRIENLTVDKLKDMIKKRIGIEQFEHKLEFISQHESYTQTLKQPILAFKSVKPNDLLFDYEFTRLFKSNETLIINLLKNKNLVINGNKSETESKQNGSIDAKIAQQIEQQNALIISQYQQIIREQDLKLKEQQQINQMLTQTCSQLQLSYQQLGSNHHTGYNEQKFTSEKLSYETRINELEVKCNLLEEKCSEQEDELCKLQREKGILQETLKNLETRDKSTEVLELKTQNQELKKNLSQVNLEQENLLTLLQEMDVKTKNYKKLLKQYGERVSDDEEDSDKSEEDYVSNNIHSILDSKETSSSDSNILINNSFHNESGSTSNSDNPEAASLLLPAPTGENINLVSQTDQFNFLKYFNNPVQTEQYLNSNDVDLK